MTADIYVQIPAYRDTELSKTLRDLVSKASTRYKLRICVLWQRGPDEFIDADIVKRKNIEIITVPFQNGKGSSWARSELQKNWKGEKYSLLIDSHHRFIKNWNLRLIEMYEEIILQGIRKPILTAYLPKYNPTTDPKGRNRHPLKIYPIEDDRWEGILYRLTSYPITFWKWLDAPVPAQYLSLHFLFTLGSFNKEVLFDENNYYAGDEILTSLKAFTHGYDFFHPHRLIGWHVYDRKTRTTHWDDHDNWHIREKKSMNLIRNVMRGTRNGMRSLGNKRTIREYEKLIGTKLIKKMQEIDSDEILRRILKEEKILVINHFLTKADCKIMLDELRFAYWRTSTVIEKDAADNFQIRESHSRLSNTASQEFFSDSANQILSLVERRLANIFRLKINSLEEWQATRYEEGGRFDYHLDCGVWNDHPSGDRNRTFLIYLDTPKAGGETNFRALNLKIKAVAGRMVVWNNLLPGGKCNYGMIHAGMPLLRGEKNVLVTWQRQKSYRINNHKK